MTRKKISVEKVEIGRNWSKLVEAGSGERSELVELGRNAGAVESRGRGPNPECPSTRTKDEDEHDKVTDKVAD